MLSLCFTLSVVISDIVFLFEIIILKYNLVLNKVFKNYNSICIFKDTKDPEYVCNILVVADQLLITRLKQICEVAAVNLSKNKTYKDCY